MCVYLDRTLEGDMLLWSTGLLSELRAMVKPWRRIEAEEWVRNLVADYGWALFTQAREVMGNHAIMYVPKWLQDKMGQ